MHFNFRAMEDMQWKGGFMLSSGMKEEWFLYWMGAEQVSSLIIIIIKKRVVSMPFYFFLMNNADVFFFTNK